LGKSKKSIRYKIKLISWLKYKWLKHKRKSVWDL